MSFRAPNSPEADRYRALRQAVEQLHRDAGVQVLAVTSPAPGDGKTVTTLNLAGSLAQSKETRVLLIDADFHRSTVASYLGLAPSGPGLADALADPHGGISRAARRLESLNVSIVLPGDSPVRPYELLASPRLGDVLAEARQLYDYVLVDTPPLVPIVDGRLLGRRVDGFLVVVAAHKTPRRLLAEALELIEPAKMLGLVFNGDDRPLSSYYGYYGYSQTQPPAADGRRL